MITYKFPQFKFDITDPTVTVDMTQITDNTVQKELTVNVLLETDTAKFGVSLSEVKYAEVWYDEDVLPLVLERLKDFEA
jgi:hypothetical protein